MVLEYQVIDQGLGDTLENEEVHEGVDQVFHSVLGILHVDAFAHLYTSRDGVDLSKCRVQGAQH